MHATPLSELLLENLPLIEKIAATICRRKGLPFDDTEEFMAELRLRLVKDDYAVLRAFQGRSSFTTYIAAVITRMLLDYQKHQWGKWHSSAEAERLGNAAMELEQRVYRDQLPREAAVESVHSAFPDTPRARLEAILDQIPQRVTRRSVDLDAAAGVGLKPDLTAIEQAHTAARISATVNRYIERLPREDRLVLQLRFDSGMTVAQIARALHQDQQVLYRRLYKRFGELRETLESAGIHAGDIAEIVGSDAVVLDFGLKNSAVRPSDSQREMGKAVGREP